MKFTEVKNTLKEDIEKIQNRKVMNVEEFHEPSIYGVFKAWRGSTEMEYFYIVFSRGIITVSLEEREMLIGSKFVSCSILSKLYDMVKHPDAKELVKEYYASKEYDEDVKNVTFKDVMSVLKWKLHSKKVVVKEGIIFD